MRYYVRPFTDRRYWIVSSVLGEGFDARFGCVMYLAVVDDFGDLAYVGPPF